MSGVKNIKELEAVSIGERDEAWLLQYSEKLKTTSLKIINEQPQAGPDGFSYLLISTDLNGDGESFADILQFCSDKGTGIVINPLKGDEPDLVLTCGMVWNFLATGQLFTPDITYRKGDLNFKDQEEVLTGQPNDVFWPAQMRKLFREFLLNQGILNAKVILVLGDTPQMQPDLCFSIESLGQPPEREWNGVLEGFSWFFPRHYSLALVSEKVLSNAPFISV